MKEFIGKYKHGIPMVVYMICYLIAFAVVEQYTKDNYTLIHVALDDKIPFVEAFVVPYMLWFPYVACFVLYFIFFDKEKYWEMFWFLVTGMTLFIVVSAVFPNGQELRPAEFARDNVFTRMIAGLYGTDTSTNILPSIHVYNSLGIHIAVMKSEKLKGHRIVRLVSGLLCTLIILSTMFIKQHSVVDVVAAFMLAVVTYPLFYVFLPRKKGNRAVAQNN